MSIEGGVSHAVDRARAVDATALQLFVKSSRQWAAKPLADEDAKRFRRRAREIGIERHTLAHAGYLINLAASDPELRRRSIESLRQELERCRVLGIPYLVLHPGSHTGSGEEEGLRRVIAALDGLLRRNGARGARRDPARGPVTVLLETTAGQGTNLGHRFDQLATILNRARCTRRLGVCFDTCHVLASGYEFRDARSYRETIREFDRTIGLERLLAFHLNDSLHPLGSRKDRHRHIGHGEVGLEPFRLILNDRRFRELPMVLETPKGKELVEDARNLAVLRAMLPAARR